MKTLDGLYNNADSMDLVREDQARGKGMRVYKREVKAFTRREHKKRKLYLLTRFEVKGVTDTYECEVLLKPQAGNQVSANPAYVYCSCAHFRYRYAYLLNESGNLIRKSELGKAMSEPPEKTNPAMVMSLCKHMLAVVEYIRSNNSSLNKLLKP